MLPPKPVQLRHFVDAIAFRQGAVVSDLHRSLEEFCEPSVSGATDQEIDKR